MTTTYELMKPQISSVDVPEDLALTWENINLYAINVKNSLFKKKIVTRTKLLRKVSGIAKAGKLCAIMGPSGSGKTTLLTAIGQRNSGDIRGEILLNGRPVTKDMMIKMSCFVPQKDLAIKSLTVMEHLRFMANLKMDQRTSQNTKKETIEMLLEEFNLSYCRWSRLSELSGGEMKRVSLAVPMLSDPPLLLCDEPTTGLDSFSAAQIVDLLRVFTAKGKLVIASVHQPASGIFEMFDTVCLLAPGGSQVFFGNVDEAKLHFSKLGFVLPPAYNTAEYLLSKLSTESQSLSRKFTDSESHKALLNDIEEISENSVHDDKMNKVFLKAYDFKTVSACTQLRFLAWRSALDLYRNLYMVFVQVALYACTAFLISVPVAHTDLDQLGIQNIQGRNFSVVVETGFAQSYSVLNTFPAEIPVVLREINNGLYKPLPYYIAKLFMLVVRTTLEALMFAAIIYLVSGASDDISFFVFALPVLLCAITSSAFGCCISAIFEDISVAMQLMNPMDFVSYITAGLFYQLNAAPVLSSLKYISRFYYGYEAMTILQWNGVNSIACSENKDLPCINTGQGVITEYGYHPNNLLLDVVGLLVMFLILNAIGFVFLLKRTRKEASY
uniref:Protein scarlet n=2 Tax=Lygus hesperus TaxID=30085 RepID=A0A146KYL8_LYGHE